MSAASTTEREKRCRDCAFRPDSPEREPGSASCAMEGASIIQMLEWRLQIAPDEPFFCHENLPTIERDGFRYVTGQPASGTTMEICAGWLEARRRLVSVAAACSEKGDSK